MIKFFNGTKIMGYCYNNNLHFSQNTKILSVFTPLTPCEEEEERRRSRRKKKKKEEKKERRRKKKKKKKKKDEAMEAMD